MGNVYEERGRVLKVLALAGTVPAAATAEEREINAQVLEGMTAEQRETVARAAKIKTPSKETWAAFVKVVRERPLAGANPFARVRRSA